MSEFSISIGSSLLWVGLYFVFMLFYTFMDIAVWRKVFPKHSDIANLIAIAFCICAFLMLLGKTGYEPRILSHFTLLGFLLSVCCSILLFIVLDRGLDRVFESLFPQSEKGYQETIQHLTNSSAVSFIQVCLLAPMIEEILMRGFLLNGFIPRYGTAAALLLSSMLFAILHFNMVQSLSAFLCGIVLGLLYLTTDSVLCCIIAHSIYNILSCAAILHSASPSPK
ncbi:MAG: CPBP family intramembrane metalloprotease [Lachnospiraceae bacterium]|nr:CPBP family intramembrane metalloprotease [Lachnospiraceae bacterium]